MPADEFNCKIMVTWQKKPQKKQKKIQDAEPGEQNHPPASVLPWHFYNFINPFSNPTFPCDFPIVCSLCKYLFYNMFITKQCGLYTK